jgi:hypothetical protein
MYAISNVTSVQQTMVKVETQFPDKQQKGIRLYCIEFDDVHNIWDIWAYGLQLCSLVDQGKAQESCKLYGLCKSGSKVRAMAMKCFPLVYSRVFFVVKGPAADATDAPQPWGLLCNPVMKMICLFVFPITGAPVEWNWQGKTEVLGEKLVPVSLCPPQIPYGLTPASNPGLCGERLATNRLSHGTASYGRLLKCTGVWLPN